MKKNLQSGSIMTEYMLVLTVLTAGLGYALIGSPWVLGSDPGGVDGDPETSDPTIINMLEEKQHEFARDIYQP